MSFHMWSQSFVIYVLDPTSSRFHLAFNNLNYLLSSIKSNLTKSAHDGASATG